MIEIAVFHKKGERGIKFRAGGILGTDSKKGVKQMDKTNFKIGMLLSSMTISAVLLVVTAGNSVRHHKEAGVEKAAAMAEREPVGFILKAYNGKAALFRENSDKPYQILDIELYLLPEVDRELLEEGIPAENEAELRKILEDWDS